MGYKILKSESKLLGLNVVQVLDFEENTLIKEVDLLIEKLKPCYIFVEIPSSKLNTIHLFETLNFQFIEFRVKAELKTELFDINPASLYPYAIKEISDKKDVKLIENYLQENPMDDRFSTDPLLNVNKDSAKRNIYNIQKSFNSKDEFLLGVYNSYTNELISFISGSYTSRNIAFLFQKGILDKTSPARQEEILNILSIDFLKNRGIDYIDVVSTGFNINELNLYLNQHKFIIQSSSVILRLIA